MRMLQSGARLAGSLLVLVIVLGAFGGPARGAEPVQGGVIRVATNAEPPTLDWQSSTTTATRLVAWHIFEAS